MEKEASDAYDTNENEGIAGVKFVAATDELISRIFIKVQPITIRIYR
jgi:hypothetical protein